MACLKSSRHTNDLIINALELDIVIDKILEHLPIRIAAQTSVLSKQWRRSWLSLKTLVFDENFCKAQFDIENDLICNLRKWSKIISSILFHHKGPVHNFDLYIKYEDESEDCMNHSHWLSFLSKNGVKKIAIDHTDVSTGPHVEIGQIASYIFCCRELEHLVLNYYRFNPPPTWFSGYQNLKHLELINIAFAQENVFLSLVKNCSVLAYLRLEDWKGMDHIVIDVCSLKTLIVKGLFKSIAFRNVQSLECISLYLKGSPSDRMKVKLIDADNLVNSCQLQSIEFSGHLCKFLVGGGILRSSPVTFKHLNTLCLTDIGIFYNVLQMLESFPCIKMLGISATPNNNDNYIQLDYNFNRKLDHLLQIKIEGITGSVTEFRLIEYLLAISTVLEKLSFTSSSRSNAMSQLKISRVLMSFSRASTKARLICLDE